MGQFIVKMRRTKAVGKMEKNGAEVEPKDAGAPAIRQKPFAYRSAVEGGGRCLAVAR